MAIPFLTLTVKGPPGFTFPLIVSPELTVRELKEEVHRLKGESPDSIKIISRGQILSDAYVLRDLGLKPGDPLWLVICIKAVKRGKQESSEPGKSELPLPELTIMKPKEVLQSPRSLPMPPIVPARVSQASEIQMPLNPMRPSEGVDSRTLPVNPKREPLPAGANPLANVPLLQSSKPNQSNADAPINPMQAAAPPSSARSPMAQQMAQMQLSAVGLQPTPESTNVFLDVVMSQPYQKLIQQACVDPQLYKSMMYMNPMFSENKELVDAICANPELIRTFQQFTSHMFSEMAKPESAAELTTSSSSAQSNTPTAVPPTSNTFAILQEMGFTDAEANLKAWLEAGGDMNEAISILQRLEK